jgi:hypothetical protein
MNIHKQIYNLFNSSLLYTQQKKKYEIKVKRIY